MSRLRVLLVTGAYFPEISSGGLQSRAVSGILKDRIDFRVLTTSTDAALPAGDAVDGIPVSRIAVDVKSRWSTASASLRMWAELLRLMPRVDLVHVQGYSSKNILVSAAAKLFGRPILLHLQTAKHDEPDTVAAQGRLAWWAFTSADHYLSVSPGLAQTYLDAGLPADRIRLAPNGVDDQRFSPPAADVKRALRQRLGLPLDRPLVLFVGVLSPDKQPHVLFEAWRELQKDPSLASTLVLVGSTSPRQFEADAGLADRIRRDAASAGLSDRVVFVPPTNEVQDYFRAADVFVMPSLREGLPIALLEAMACGLPCVASHLRGATDVIVEHGVNGRLVPVGDVAALGKNLAAVLADPAGAARMGAAARRTVEERYTFPLVAEQWLAAYESASDLR